MVHPYARYYAIHSGMIHHGKTISPGRKRVRFAPCVSVRIVEKLPLSAIVGDCRSSSDPNWCALAQARRLRQVTCLRTIILRHQFKQINYLLDKK